jgi:hypothetical protein
MWDIDNFPGADHVPWQLLIRARLVREIDAVIASTVVRNLAEVASSKVTAGVTRAAQAGLEEGNREQATSEQRLAAIAAALDFDDWCPTRPRHWPWPGPRPHFEDLTDPVADVVIAQALELVRRAGSEQLQKSLGSALAELSPAYA